MDQLRILAGGQIVYIVYRHTEAKWTVYNVYIMHLFYTGMDYCFYFGWHIGNTITATNFVIDNCVSVLSLYFISMVTLLHAMAHSCFLSLVKQAKWVSLKQLFVNCSSAFEHVLMVQSVVPCLLYPSSNLN